MEDDDDDDEMWEEWFDGWIGLLVTTGKMNGGRSKVDDFWVRLGLKLFFSEKIHVLFGFETNSHCCLNLELV